MARYLQRRGTGEIVIYTELFSKRADMSEITEKDALAILSGKAVDPDESGLSTETRLVLIKEAIPKLDPISGWTKGGKDNPGSVPNCVALSEEVGFEVKAAERDIALEDMEKPE